jgi:hypothetical protein
MNESLSMDPYSDTLRVPARANQASASPCLRRAPAGGPPSQRIVPGSQLHGNRAPGRVILIRPEAVLDGWRSACPSLDCSCGCPVSQNSSLR